MSRAVLFMLIDGEDIPSQPCSCTTVHKSSLYPNSSSLIALHILSCITLAGSSNRVPVLSPIPDGPDVRAATTSEPMAPDVTSRLISTPNTGCELRQTGSGVTMSQGRIWGPAASLLGGARAQAVGTYPYLRSALTHRGRRTQVPAPCLGCRQPRGCKRKRNEIGMAWRCVLYRHRTHSNRTTSGGIAIQGGSYSPPKVRYNMLPSSSAEEERR